jgi:hypothetical protein
MRNLILFAIVLFSAFARADINQEAAVIRQLLAPNVMTLDRDIKVYHYFSMSNPKREVDVNHPVFTNYFKRGIVKHWTEIITDEEVAAVVGAGIYAATDPIKSRNYGNTALEITIKKGTRILVGVDVRVPRASAKILDLERWMSKNQTELSTAFPLFATAYREPYLKVLAELKVAAVSYIWQSGAFKICKFADDPDARYEVEQFKDTPAFVVAGIPRSLGDALKGQNIDMSMFTVKGITNQPGKLAGEKKEIYERVERVSRYLNDGPTLNPSLKVGAPSAAEVASLKKQIFNCTAELQERPFFVRAPKDAAQ